MDLFFIAEGCTDRDQHRSAGWSALAIGATAATIVLLSMPAAAEAQINPFRGYRGPPLSKSDIELGTQAAGRLLGDDPKPVGAIEEWTNPETGDGGTLTIERAFHRVGNECRAVRSRITYKAGTKRGFLLNACRVSGKWKLWD